MTRRLITEKFQTTGEKNILKAFTKEKKKTVCKASKIRMASEANDIHQKWYN